MICVRTEDLRLGMYIASVEGSWLRDPVWRSEFLLVEDGDLRLLQTSGVDSVRIDLQKSLPPAVSHLVPPESVAQPWLKQELECAAAAKRASAAKPRRRRGPPSNEFDAAQTVLEDCKAAVGELFAQIRSGNVEALDDADRVVSDIADSVARNPHALLALTRVRSLDEYTYLHSIAVSALMINLARQLGLSVEFVKQAGVAGLFMDVGKAFLDPQLLRKPGSYSDEDWALMRRHPQLGADAVKASGDMSRIVADVCLHHHERYDGSGYPEGLSGDEISLFSRMAGICDTYDALASDRPHRRGLEPAQAVAELYKLKGHFDESLVTSFIRSIGIYPVGSLVRLSSGMLACVSAQRRDQLTRPVVRIFYSMPRRSLVEVRELDLAQAPELDRIVSREDPGRWKFSDWETLSLTILQGQTAKRAA